MRMPPSHQPPPFDPTDHLLTQGRRSSVGPVVGIIIIIVLMVVGGLYFWGAYLNQEPHDPPPSIATNNLEDAQ